MSFMLSEIPGQFSFSHQTMEVLEGYTEVCLIMKVEGIYY